LAAQYEVTAVQQVLVDGGPDACYRHRDVPCPQVLEQARRPATATEVTQRLIWAGYRNAEAHAARPDDLAPLGSIMHAVALGPVCLIGFQRTWERVDGETIMGTRPDGTCLAP
jgi:hypothetical protein